MKWTEGRDLIRTWFEIGVRSGARFLVVIWDCETDDQYPIFVVNGSAEAFIRAMVPKDHEVTEVYSMGLSMEQQLSEGVAMHVKCVSECRCTPN